jgi:hypothetical protein
LEKEQALVSKPLTALALVATLGWFAGLAAPASAITPLNATWMITYYLDPLGTTGATECINFHKKADISGVVTGTWNSPTFSGWFGQYVQKGQHYSWYGTYSQSGQTYATYDAGDFINANITAEPSIGVFSTGARKPTTVYTGTATMVQVQSCSGMPVYRGASPVAGF